MCTNNGPSQSCGGLSLARVGRELLGGRWFDAPERRRIQRLMPRFGRLSARVAPCRRMASIAQLYYKNRARWKDIQDANFNSLEGTVKIKPGMVLIIP